MRALGNGRERKAVLGVLAAVGERGMSLIALAIALDLPEAKLQALLNQLVLAGQVQCVQDWGGLRASARSRYSLIRRLVDQIPAQRSASEARPRLIQRA